MKKQCDLSELELEYLKILQEECAEVIQIISKIDRFGIDSYHPADSEKITNDILLTQEIGDVLALIELVRDIPALKLTQEALDIAKEDKKKRLGKWLRNGNNR